MSLPDGVYGGLESGRWKRCGEGSGGNNTLLFNGANVNENITLSPTARVSIFSVTLATSRSTSRRGRLLIQRPRRGGHYNVGRPDGRCHAGQRWTLASPRGTTNATGRRISVIVNGKRERCVQRRRQRKAVEVTGVAALVHVTGGELANDRIVINGSGATRHINGTSGPHHECCPLSVAATPGPSSRGFTIPVDVSAHSRSR